MTTGTKVVDRRQAASVQGNAPGVNWDEVVFPDEMKNLIAQDVRTDTAVIFNASKKWFYRKNSSLFNRLIVALLLQIDAITLNPGRLAKWRWWYRNRWLVLMEKPTDVIRVEHVVPRLGTHKECPKFFLSSVWNATLKKWKGELDCSKPDITAHSHYPKNFLVDDFMEDRGELEYEVVFLCVSTAIASQLLQSIQAAAQDVTGQIFNLQSDALPDFPDFLVPEWKELFFSRAIYLGSFVCPFALRVSTTSRASLAAVFENINYPYYLFGIKVTEERYTELATEQQTYVPILFHGPAIRLKISDADGGNKWIKVIQSHEDYPLRDAHNLLDAEAMLEVARKNWTVERMIEVGWRLTLPTSENWRSFVNF